LLTTLFTRPETETIVLNSWRHLQAHHDFRLHGSVVLENHLHLIAGSPQIGKDIQRCKSYTARCTIDRLESVGARRLLDLLALFKRMHKTQSRHQFWEEGSHPQRIESGVVMRQKLDYIHYNPVKRGFVDLPEHWRWSSAWDYADAEGSIEVDREW
jgi:REP element-mobilizing transposase RayT